MVPLISTAQTLRQTVATELLQRAYGALRGFHAHSAATLLRRRHLCAQRGQIESTSIRAFGCLFWACVTCQISNVNARIYRNPFRAPRSAKLVHLVGLGNLPGRSPKHDNAMRNLISISDIDDSCTKFLQFVDLGKPLPKTTTQHGPTKT